MENNLNFTYHKLKQVLINCVIRMIMKTPKIILIKGQNKTRFIKYLTTKSSFCASCGILVSLKWFSSHPVDGVARAYTHNQRRDQRSTTDQPEQCKEEKHVVLSQHMDFNKNLIQTCFISHSAYLRG